MCGGAWYAGEVCAMKVPSPFVRSVVVFCLLAAVSVSAVSAQDKSSPPPKAPAEVIAQQRELAKARALKDRERYSAEQLAEIEGLYQSANKDLKAPDAKGKLEKLVAEFGGSNRAGCALLYLGQNTRGEEQVRYLKMAMETSSDCFYGDGVQVGPYARYYLARRYLKEGRTKEGEELFQEIAAKYPDAITHSGSLLSSALKPTKAGE